MKLCECGCGKEVGLYLSGPMKGQLTRFIKGHYWNGKNHSEKTKTKISLIKKGKPNLKSSETKKKLFMEGKLIPWNKGKTGIYSKETKQKMGVKGHIPWNKGKTGIYTESHLKENSKRLKQLFKEGKLKPHIPKGSTYEEIYGKEKADIIKKKISITEKKRYASGEKVSWCKGQKRPEISKILTELYKNKENCPMYGKHHTEEVKEKLSLSKLKEKNPNHINLEPFKDKIIGLYQGGYGGEIIGLIYNVSAWTIIHKLREWGIKIKSPYYCDKHKRIRCDDGHIVRSSNEAFIDNWLFHNGIIHIYDKQIGDTKSRCDFYIPDANVYIEYWGLKGIGFYDEKTIKKVSLYKDLRLKLLSIFPQDNIKDKLNFLIPLCDSKQKIILDFTKKNRGI